MGAGAPNSDAHTTSPWPIGLTPQSSFPLFIVGVQPPQVSLENLIYCVHSRVCPCVHSRVWPSECQLGYFSTSRISNWFFLILFRFCLFLLNNFTSKWKVRIHFWVFAILLVLKFLILFYKLPKEIWENFWSAVKVKGRLSHRGRSFLCWQVLVQSSSLLFCVISPLKFSGFHEAQACSK